MHAEGLAHQHGGDHVQGVGRQIKDRLDAQTVGQGRGGGHRLGRQIPQNRIERQAAEMPAELQHPHRPAELPEPDRQPPVRPPVPGSQPLAQQDQHGQQGAGQ